MKTLLTTCAAILLVLSSLPAQTGQVGKDKKTDLKKKDTDPARYERLLEARFKEWDDNNDKILDTAELARAFRGPKAKAIDAVPDFKTQVKATSSAVAVNSPPIVKMSDRKVRPIHVALLTLPRHSLFGNVILAEVLSQPTPIPEKTPPTPTLQPKPPVATPNPLTFPDFQFLTLVDKNRDSKISQQEFESFSKDYARMLDKLEDAQSELKAAQNKAQAAKSKQAKVQAQQEVQKHQQEVQAANAQLSNIPPAIHKALKVRP